MAAKKRKSGKKKTKRLGVVPNQVFIGLPWSLRPKWDRAIDGLRTKSALSFVIVGRNDSQDAEDLLAVIKGRIESSSFGIFDATGGNANVSLEYGFAEASDLPRALYVSTHKSAKKGAKDAPIISDLAGKRRNQYKQEASLRKLLTEFAKSHAYSLRFENFLKSEFRRATPGEKKRVRALALKIIHRLDGVATIRRADVVQALLTDVSKYGAPEIDAMIKKLHASALLLSQQGPYAKLAVR